MSRRQQREITEAGLLLDEQGRLNECGFARTPLLQYDRTSIETRRGRIREWDRYVVFDDEFAITVAISSNKKIGFFSLAFTDLVEKTSKSLDIPAVALHGSMRLPESSTEGMFGFRDGRITVSTNVKRYERRLHFEAHDFDNGRPFGVRLALLEEPQDSLVFATPIEDGDKTFCLNRQIVGLRAQGTVNTPYKTHAFLPDTSFAILDWSRGVWQRKATWRWACACGVINDTLVGFTAGTGRGITDVATPDMLFVNGISHKLDDVSLDIPTRDSGKPSLDATWTLASADGTFHMDFVPLTDRISKTNLAVLNSERHQVFGHFSGTAVCEDGATIEISDLLGFIETARNKW